GVVTPFVFSLLMRPPPPSTLFPYTTLFRSPHLLVKIFSFKIGYKRVLGFNGIPLCLWAYIKIIELTAPYTDHAVNPQDIYLCANAGSIASIVPPSIPFCIGGTSKK